MSVCRWLRKVLKGRKKVTEKSSVPAPKPSPKPTTVESRPAVKPRKPPKPTGPRRSKTGLTKGAFGQPKWRRAHEDR